MGLQVLSFGEISDLIHSASLDTQYTLQKGITKAHPVAYIMRDLGQRYQHFPCLLLLMLAKLLNLP